MKKEKFLINKISSERREISESALNKTIIERIMDDLNELEKLVQKLEKFVEIERDGD